MQKSVQCREVQYHMQQLLQQLLVSKPALSPQLAQMQILQCLKVTSFTLFPPKTLSRLSTRTHGGVSLLSLTKPADVMEPSFGQVMLSSHKQQLLLF